MATIYVVLWVFGGVLGRFLLVELILWGFFGTICIVWGNYVILSGTFASYFV